METTQFVDGDVAMVTEAVWTSILGLELEPLDTGEMERTRLPRAALVNIAGAWNGAVLLRCDLSVSSRLASILHGTDEPSEEERSEALAEVSQLVAGNIKSLLPGPSKRSMSAVFEGDQCQIRFPGSRTIADVRFRTEGALIRVTVIQLND